MLTLVAFEIISKRLTEQGTYMKVWTQVPAGDINAANQRLWGAIGDNAEEVASRINTDPTFVANIARLMINGGYEPSDSQKLAREIMGNNFFGIEEAIKHFGVNATKQQLAILAEVPWSEEVLRASKDTHVLVAVFPLSILDIRGIIRKPALNLFYFQDWYDKQEFAKNKGKVGWQLIRKVPVTDSISKTWNEQQALLSQDEETPTARIVVYTMVGILLARGEYLFYRVCVNCIDNCVDHGSSHRKRVVTGFNYNGIRLRIWSDDSSSEHIGLSAAKKQ